MNVFYQFNLRVIQGDCGGYSPQMQDYSTHKMRIIKLPISASDWGMSLPKSWQIATLVSLRTFHRFREISKSSSSYHYDRRRESVASDIYFSITVNPIRTTPRSITNNDPFMVDVCMNSQINDPIIKYREVFKVLNDVFLRICSKLSERAFAFPDPVLSCSHADTRVGSRHFLPPSA